MMSNLPNLGFLFYKNYYTKDIIFNNENKGLINNTFLKKNKEILSQKVISNMKSIVPNIGKQSFSLKIIYPGLLIGSGYMHGIDNEEDFKIGFYFDYTSGLPCIPGSSVKGMLRSSFKYENYIKNLIKNLGLNDETIDVEQLKNEIFGKETGKDNLPTSKRDIFFDAVIDIDKCCNEKIFSDDYITPHYKNELQDPTPIKFMKVSPNIVFNFQFDLKDGILKAEDKLRLFKNIILDLGIGAKSNVGYGKFDEI